MVEDLLEASGRFKIDIVWVRDTGNLTISDGERATAKARRRPYERCGRSPEWRDGLVSEWQMFATPPDALEAAGLSE